MTSRELILRRLSNQQITSTDYKTPGELIHWMIAMQSQEYSMAKWAVGLRLKKLREADIEMAFNEGSILRTHLLRPTWHFVSPADIRWLLKLTAPRIKAIMKYYFSKNELDPKTLKRSKQLLEENLTGGRYQDRAALKSLLEKSGIRINGERLSLILMDAELEAIICSGPRVRKQFSYALLEERVPVQKNLSRGESLESICRGYFQSRGPATLQDFVYWSGLTVKDAIQGADSLGRSFLKENIQGKEYIFSEENIPAKMNRFGSLLLPVYDEYGMSYKDKGALHLRGRNEKKGAWGTNSFAHGLVIRGRFIGTWKKSERGKPGVIETSLEEGLSPAHQKLLKSALKRYNLFFGY